MGKLSKDKGKRGEREVRDLMIEYGFEARRGQQYSGGDDSPDVKHNIPSLHVEVKRTERIRLSEALEQANADKGKDEDAVIFHRASHQPWLITMDAKAFLAIMCDLVKYEQVSEG